MRENHKTDSNNEQPLAYVSANGKHRIPSGLSVFTNLSGFVATIFSSILVENHLMDRFKEQPSQWRKDISLGGGFIEGVTKSLAKYVDKNNWRSSLGGLATIAGGIILTERTVTKIEHNTFKKRYGNHPAFTANEQECDREAMKTSSSPSSQAVSNIETSGKITQAERNNEL